MSGPVLILGGRSDIGLATAHALAAAGQSIILAARNAERLADEKSDLTLRHSVEVDAVDFDALDVASHEAFVKGLAILPEVVVCVVGLLGDQAADERDLAAARLVMRSNYEGPASILSAFANAFEARGSGVIVGVSSVAGERGRATNYIYGSAKAGFTAFLSGLRNRLARKGVHVVTVLPGFVDTRMTAGMNLPKALTATPQEVAAAIVEAVRRRQDVVYVRKIWSPIMAAIRAMPESVFKRARI